MEEMGPFLTQEDAKYPLRLNRYAWNNAATVLFLEHPQGVGFSYTNTSSDLHSLDDEFAVSDLYNFLLSWFKRFPLYKEQDFYISGREYAGHYIPQLAWKIINQNSKADSNSINLKGFIIGSPVLDNRIEKKATANRPRRSRDKVYWTDSSQWYGWSRTFMCPLKPCVSRFTEEYLNRVDVQEALHANVTGIAYPWKQCSDIIRTQGTADPSVVPIIRKLVTEGGLRIWMYSGENDRKIPVVATKTTLRKLRLSVKRPWRPWYLRKRVGGRVIVYNGLTYVTIQGAGHRVATFKPAMSDHMIQYFLTGKELPHSPK